MRRVCTTLIIHVLEASPSTHSVLPSYLAADTDAGEKLRHNSLPGNVRQQFYRVLVCGSPHIAWCDL